MNSYVARKQDAVKYAKEHGIKLWQIAEVWGCNDGNFSRKLRRLSDDDVIRVKTIVDGLLKEGAADAE